MKYLSPFRLVVDNVSEFLRRPLSHVCTARWNALCGIILSGLHHSVFVAQILRANCNYLLPTRGRVFTSRLSVSACFPHNILKIDAARIGKLVTEMFHDASWNWETHLFWDQKVKGEGDGSQKNSAGVGLCTLVSAGFS